MLVQLQPQPLPLPYREKLVILYWYILTPLHLLLHICIYDRIFRLLSRPFFWKVFRGGSAGGRRVWRLRAVDFFCWAFIDSSGGRHLYFTSPLGHFDFVRTRTCLSSAVVRWCNDEPCGFWLLLYYFWASVCPGDIYLLVVMFCIMLLKNPWRTLALFAYRWYVMRFYLRN